ncbi:MAG TPA: endonuclease/exonuclease/phosphatase family protein [Luteimonas sp.]|nr:endonuclease/exonuclease/phosphatase family protein [Luteimonas sp.]
MTPPALRIATYNTSLFAETDGGLEARLLAGDANAGKIAAVLQRVRPDVVLLNEFDFDAKGRAADLFMERYLAVAQVDGGAALRYPYRYFAPVNTGVSSGLDLDRNGGVGGEGRDRGNDAWGYGLHPGQYGMLLLSMHPIDTGAVRTFQLLKWSAMPGARRPVDPQTGQPWHADATWTQLRLSSKSHWDVPVRTPLGVVHVLAAHPTPPVFDGPEDRNGARNHDEIRLWREYLSGDAPWLCDDRGRCGGLPDGARFVILGDLNNDPDAGDGIHAAIRDLLAHPRVLRHPVPRSAGAHAAVLAQAADAAGAAGAVGAHDARPARAADAGSAAPAPMAADAARPRHVATGDFGPRVGPLRLDYVLPSANLRRVGGGVFWPAPDQSGAAIVVGTDHRLVWADLAD